jgi:hypothetical protein
LPARGSVVHHAVMKYALLATMLFALLPAPAVACSIPYDPRPLEAQMDDWARFEYPRAEAMVEVIALKGSVGHRPGKVRIVRVFKGNIRPGRVLRLHAVEASLCGAGGFAAGSRGLTLINRLGGRMDFLGWRPDDYLRRLDRLGLRPIATPVLPAYDR